MTLIASLLFTLMLASAFGPSTDLNPSEEWRFYGHDPGGARYSPLRQIHTLNVSQLRTAWTFHMGETHRLPNISPDREAPAFEATPLVVDGVLYFSTPSARVIALDAETGRKLWEFDSQAHRAAKRGYHQHRGVSFWVSRSMGSPRAAKGSSSARGMHV